MANIIKMLRSITSGSRPAGKTYGEPYVNFADNQFGVFDSSNVARDLIGVPYFSAAMGYNAGQAVNQGGQVYIARTAVAAAAFNPAQWTPVMSQRDYAGGDVNKFRNCAFEFWQRGTSVTIGNIAYTADGWIVTPNVGMSVLKVATGSLGSPYQLELQGVVGLTNVAFGQRIESARSIALGVQPVTVQFKVFNQTGVAFTPQIRVDHATVANNFATTAIDLQYTNLQPCPNGVWTTVAYTFTVPFNSAANGLYVILGFLAAANASGKNIFIGEPDIRVTPGYPVGLCNNPPPPELRMGGTDDYLNYRYYQAPALADIFIGYIVTGSAYGMTWRFGVPMRTAPSMVFTEVGNQGFPAGFQALSIYSTGYYATKMCNVDYPGGYFQFTWTATAEL